MSLAKNEILSQLQAVAQDISTDEKVLLVGETVAPNQICVFLHSNPTEDESYLVVKGRPTNLQFTITFATQTFKSGEIHVARLKSSYTFFESNVVPYSLEIPFEEIKTVKFRTVARLLALVKSLILEHIDAVYEEGDLDDKALELVRKEIAWEQERDDEFAKQSEAEMKEQKAQKTLETKAIYEDTKQQYLSKVIDLSTVGQKDDSFEYSWSRQALAQAQIPQAQKKALIDTWLQSSKITIEINTDAEGVWLPPYLMEKETVKLNLSYSFKTSIFEIHATHIVVDLSFGGTKFLCFIPLKSIYGIMHNQALEKANNVLTDENCRMYSEDAPQFVSEIEEHIQRLSDEFLKQLGLQLGFDFDFEKAENKTKTINFEKAKKKLAMDKKPTSPKKDK